jgi:hypothetical protein
LLVPPKNCDIKGPKVKPFNVVETARLAGEPQLKVTTQEVSGC